MRRAPKILAKIGDVLSIRLPDGRFAYAQYLYLHAEYGTLIRVYDLITEVEASSEDLAAVRDRFPPVFVGMNVSIRKKIWRVIGSLPIDLFQFPTFRISTKALLNERQVSTYDDWLLWDGSEYRKVGMLQPESRGLEFLCCWAGDLLEERIVTGRNLFGELV